jgi:uncharacterized protein YceH (UPF0502 family)
MKLSPVQIRVLGSLVEKEITTPENYPLSLNALVNACNQKSSRDPVMELTEDEVRQALHALEEHDLINAVHDARVPKYENRIRTVLNLRRDETAVLCLLMLRGPQTPGELRGRSDRLFTFDDISAVQSTIERLGSRTPEDAANGQQNASSEPLTAALPRQPGSREVRYVHLLGEMPEPVSFRPVDTPATATPPPENLTQRFSEMEASLERLTTTVAALEQRLADLETKI